MLYAVLYITYVIHNTLFSNSIVKLVGISTTNNGSSLNKKV